jgi:Domain of unknown function (DUF1338)
MKTAKIAQQLWSLLWQEYQDRVIYARSYQQMIEEAGGSIANDHIAFRTLRLTIDQNGRSIQLGLPYLARIVEALGYHQAGEYHFPAQCLYARHYVHPEQDSYDLPKLFISELIVDDLPKDSASLIKQTVQSGDFLLDTDLLQLESINSQTTDFDRQAILAQLAHLFDRPWQPPQQFAVEQVNIVSQYGAWVMMHGYAVNHFTGYVNRQQTTKYQTIAQTIAGLTHLGVPMKSGVEGSIESGLCQTATQAVIEQVWVQNDAASTLMQIPWPYAYYEIAERYQIKNSAGDTMLFDGFLSVQAQQLFEMTRRSSNELSSIPL